MINKGGDVLKLDFEYRKLRGKIVEVFGSYARFAEALGVSSVTVSNKLNNKTQFSQDDIIDWCNALHVPVAESGTYFFT